MPKEGLGLCIPKDTELQCCKEETGQFAVKNTTDRRAQPLMSSHLEVPLLLAQQEVGHCHDAVYYRLWPTVTEDLGHCGLLQLEDSQQAGPHQPTS